MAIDPVIWQDHVVHRAFATRDVGAVYRHLVAAGVSQQRIARATGQSPSEVSEILSGRQVQSYNLLVRIADGLGVPRGWMGLSYDEGNPSVPSDEEEVDEDVKRRNLLAAGATVLFGQPVFGVPDAKALTFRDVITSPPQRIGMTDVSTFEQVTSRLGVLDREAGGIAARETLAAVAHGGEQLLTAQADGSVRQRLLGAVSEAHRLAGWASGDVGLMDHCRWHMQRAMSHAKGDPERLAGVLASAGDMEKHYDAPDEALKFFQLASVGLLHSADPQAGAVVHGLSASAYLTLGHADQARAELHTARVMFGDALAPEASLPFFAFYGPGYGLLAATGSKLASYDAARTDVLRALRVRPAYDVRCRALDTIVLATILVNAGEVVEGITETRRALSLVTTVGSQRARDRLEPLEQALLARRDSTCQDLARRLRTLRTPQPEPDTTV